MSTASLDSQEATLGLRPDTAVPHGDARITESDLLRAARRQPASVDRPVESPNSLLKFLGKIAGIVWALPHIVCYVLARIAMGNEKAFRSASERIAAVPGMLGVYARQWFYVLTLDEVGDDVYFGYMSMFSKPNITIGDRVFIGRFCSIGLADLGDEAMLADGVQVLSGKHHHGGKGSQGVTRDLTFSKVVIGSRAWIGANAVIMAHVGEEAIVGAGAVVTKMVYEREKVAGVPARPMMVQTTSLAA